LISLILIDIALPVVGLGSILLFRAIKPLYNRIYSKENLRLKESEDVNNAIASNHGLSTKEFQKEMDYQSAKTNIIHTDIIEQTLYDSFQIQPYVDIFLGKNVDMKVNACIKLSSFETTQAVSLLRKALQDKDYEVRYMANNALGTLEQNLLSIIDLLNENIKKHPANLDYYKERAINYIKIYKLNILDTTISILFLKRALEDLEFLVERNVDDYSIYLQLCNAYINLDMNTEVINFCKRIDLSKLDITTLEKIKFYEAESYFKLKDFKSLTTKSKDMNSDNINFEFIRNITEYWANINEQ